MPQLRVFNSYGRTTPFQMLNRAGQLFRCTLADLNGNIAAGGKWLQLHDVAAALAGGEVPLMSFNAGAGAGPLPSLFQTLGPITFNNGMTIAVSSTETTYTADATSYDVFGDIEEFEGYGDLTVFLGLSVAGDLTTTRNTLAVWANGVSNSSRLYKMVINEKVTAKHFICINSGQSNTVDSGFALRTVLPSGGTVVLDFGDDGLNPMFNQTTGSGTTLYNGCTIYIVDANASGNFPVGGPYTLTTNSATIKAWYKT